MSSDAPPPRLEAAPLPVDVDPAEDVPLSVDMILDPSIQGAHPTLADDSSLPTAPPLAGDPSAGDNPMESEDHVPIRRRTSTASSHGSEDTESWPDARTPPLEGEGVESSIPAPSNPVPVVVYLDRASAQTFLDTFAPHTWLFPSL